MSPGSELAAKLLKARQRLEEPSTPAPEPAPTSPPAPASATPGSLDLYSASAAPFTSPTAPSTVVSGFSPAGGRAMGSYSEVSPARRQEVPVQVFPTAEAPQAAHGQQAVEEPEAAPPELEAPELPAVPKAPPVKQPEAESEVRPEVEPSHTAQNFVLLTTPEHDAELIALAEDVLRAPSPSKARSSLASTFGDDCDWIRLPHLEAAADVVKDYEDARSCIETHKKVTESATRGPMLDAKQEIGKIHIKIENRQRKIRSYLEFPARFPVLTISIICIAFLVAVKHQAEPPLLASTHRSTTSAQPAQQTLQQLSVPEQPELSLLQDQSEIDQLKSMIQEMQAKMALQHSRVEDFGSSTPSSGTGFSGSSTHSGGTALFDSSAHSSGAGLSGSSTPSSGTGLFGSAPSSGTGLSGISTLSSGIGLLDSSAHSSGTGLSDTSAPSSGAGLSGSAQVIYREL